MDLEKAFDRVVRTKLWETLPRYIVSGPLLQAVKSLYIGYSACVRVGAMQGYAMSFCLFNLYFDSCLQEVKQNDIGVKVAWT